MLLSDSQLGFRIRTAIVLEEVYDDNGHVVRPNAVSLPHFLEGGWTYFIQQVVVGVVDVLHGATVDW